MTTHEKLTEFLEANFIEHFTGREICTLRRAGIVVDPPPERMWYNIIPALCLAEELRERVGHPLLVGNGYRPADINRRVGGSRRSRHVTFHALDLDLPRAYSSREHQERLYEEAVSIYLECRGKTPGGIGLGLYRLHRGKRVHFDAGSGRWRDAYWSRSAFKSVAEGLR